MPSQQTHNKPEARLSIRADQMQKSVLVEETRIVLSSAEYDWLVKEVDESSPPTLKPGLREAMNQKPVWDA